MAERTVFETLFDLVLVALALLVLFGAYKGISAVLQSRDNASVQNYEEIIKQIEEMKENDKKIVPIYIKEDKMVVGFSDGSGTTLDIGSCTTGDMLSQVVKPEYCGTKPCLCICDIKSQCTEKPQCKSFSTKFSFRGGGACPHPVIIGSKKPQSVELQKFSDSFRMCIGQC